MVNIPSGSPLTESHYDEIQKGLAAVKQAREQIALAERAGIDVGQQKASTNDLERKLLNLKQVYFPGRP